MATSDPPSPRAKTMSGRRRKASAASPAASDSGESVCSDRDGLAGGDADSRVDLATLLMRPPTEDERRGWAVLSPPLRRRAADRIALLRRWWGERDGLTAKEAAAIAGVIPNRFYQMAAVWKREPGLLAVGAYAAAPAARSPRIHPLVNASLQANVVKVVAEAGEASVEAMRRRLEELVAADLRDRRQAGSDGTDAGGGGGEPDGSLAIPSPTVVRAVITRELNRVGEAKLAGESVAMDCCPTTMRAPSGEPWALFAIIDRGTLRILGSAVGSLDDSVAGYAFAARRALILLAPGTGGSTTWARSTRRVDMVVGEDRAECDALIARYGAVEAAVEFKPVTRPRRFGSQLRKYIGERVGRIQLRPGWAASPPPMADDDETFAWWDAAARADFEVQGWNEIRTLVRETPGEDRPPNELVALLRLLVEGSSGPVEAG